MKLNRRLRLTRSILMILAASMMCRVAKVKSTISHIESLGTPLKIPIKQDLSEFLTDDRAEHMKSVDILGGDRSSMSLSKPLKPQTLVIPSKGITWLEKIRNVSAKFQEERYGNVDPGVIIMPRSKEMNLKLGPSRRYGLIDPTTGRRIVFQDDPRDHNPGSTSLELSIRSWIHTRRKERDSGVSRVHGPLPRKLGEFANFRESIESLPDAPEITKSSLPAREFALGLLRGMGYNESDVKKNINYTLPIPSPWIGRRGVGSTAPIVTRWESPTLKDSLRLTSAAEFNTTEDGFSPSFTFESHRAIALREQKELELQRELEGENENSKSAREVRRDSSSESRTDKRRRHRRRRHSSSSQKRSKKHRK